MSPNDFCGHVLNHVNNNLKNGFVSEAKAILEAMDQLSPETPIPTERFFEVIETVRDIIARIINSGPITDAIATLEVINKLPSGIIILENYLSMIIEPFRDDLIRLIDEGNASATSIILKAMNNLSANTPYSAKLPFPRCQNRLKFYYFYLRPSGFLAGRFCHRRRHPYSLEDATIHTRSQRLIFEYCRNRPKFNGSGHQRL